MHLRASACSVAVLFILAGCITEEPPKADEEGSEPGFAYEDDRIKIRSINKSAAEWQPTLKEPPEWTLGQWWKVKVTDGFVGNTREAYRVVAGQEDDHWLVGMPTHDFSNDLMVLHIPGFGQIAKADLGFEAHDHWFSFVPFPLEEDKTWKTSFQAADNLECSVLKIDGLKADMECIGTYHIVYTYDAELRAVSTFAVEGYGTYEIIDSGFAFHEDVPELDPVITVPHMADLIFFHGRLGGAVQISPDGGPVGGFGVTPIPMETAEIPSTYDRVSFSLILGDIIGLGIPATLFQETATAPDGTAYRSVLTPLDGVPLKIDSFKHDAPGGTWELEHIAAGPGVAFIEGIGYHVYDIELPSGRLLPSVGEHEHGTGEGH